MTYLRILRLLAGLLRRAMRYTPDSGRAWATMADWDGRIAFRQIDYARRVQAAAGWEPVTITSSPWWPAVTTASSGAGSVTYTYADRRDYRR